MTSFWISVFVPMSMPRVGSSRIRKSQFVASHRARMTFCWLPPDSCLTSVSRLAVLISRSFMYLSAISICFCIGIFLKIPAFAWIARQIFSRTERSPMIPSTFRSSGSMPMPSIIESIGALIFEGFPLMLMLPVEALSAP